MNDSIPSKSIRINFKDVEMEQIMFLMKHFSKSNTHDLIRAVLDKTYQREKEILLKYSNNKASKETIPEKTRRILEMTDEAMTAYFYETGVFKDEVMQGAPDVKISYRIGVDKNSGQRAELITYTQKNPEFPPYENAGRWIDDIINESIKKKIL